jgi:putative SOS response-associated peptidase YedK
MLRRHKRRCIIPANGYFEWLQPQGVPYCITLKYSDWKDPSNGARTQNFAIITTHGNEILADFNDNYNYNDEEDPRMPVILQPDDYDYWFDP